MTERYTFSSWRLGGSIVDFAVLLPAKEEGTRIVANVVRLEKERQSEDATGRRRTGTIVEEVEEVEEAEKVEKAVFLSPPLIPFDLFDSFDPFDPFSPSVLHLVFRRQTIMQFS